MQALKELHVSNDAMNDPEELRHRISEEGYLFFKQLQDPDKTLGIAARDANDDAGRRLARRGDRPDGRHRRYFLPSVPRAIPSTRMYTTKCISYKRSTVPDTGPKSLTWWRRLSVERCCHIHRRSHASGFLSTLHIQHRYTKILSISKAISRPILVGHRSEIAQ